MAMPWKIVVLLWFWYSMWCQNVCSGHWHNYFLQPWQAVQASAQSIFLWCLWMTYLPLIHRFLQKIILLKFCYVPATRAASPKIIFVAATNSTNQANKVGVTYHLITLSYLDVYTLISQSCLIKTNLFRIAPVYINNIIIDLFIKQASFLRRSTLKDFIAVVYAMTTLEPVL